MGEKLAYLSLAHRGRMTAPVEQHEASHPVGVRALGSRAVTPRAGAMSHALQQSKLSRGLREATEVRGGNLGGV
jgi:hypothetical protein